MMNRLIVVSKLNLLSSIIYFSLLSGTILNYHSISAFTPDPLNQTSNAGSSVESGPSFLKVIVQVDNTGGGTAKPSDFSISIVADNNANPAGFDGSTAGTMAAMTGDGHYQVAISQKGSVTPSYGVTFSGDCKLNEIGRGAGNIASGDRKTCIATMIFPDF
jgi:hypothetical protein